MVDQTPLELADYIMMFLLMIALPIWSYWDHKRFERDLSSGDAAVLRTSYIKTLYLLWTPTLLITVLWLVSARDFGALGLSLAPTVSGAIGLGVVLVITGLLTAQVFQAKNNKEVAAKFMAELERSPSVDNFLPKTEDEYRLFKGLSITAGITEEILFRGYLIWAFSHWTESWLAALLSLAAFTLAHLYQGTTEAIGKVALTGGILTLLYMLSGSLIPAIILHAVIDLTSGATCWYARRNGQQTA